MNNFVIGQYVPGKSYLHKLDPRVKILSTMILMVAIFFIDSIYGMLAAIAIIILMLVAAKLSLSRIIRGLKPLLFLAIFVFVFQVFFNKGGEVLFTSQLVFSLTSIISLVLLTFLFLFFFKYLKFKFLFFIVYISLVFVSLIYLKYPSIYYSLYLSIYKDGLTTSLFVFLRLIAVVSIATILTLTTKPTDLTKGIEFLMSPLKIFKVNPEEFALIISIALRYIPTIFDEAFKIMDAQASRGADFKQGNIFKKIGQLVSLLVPMFIISFERSEQLTDAMESRNFVPGKHKTKYLALKWKKTDTLTLILSLLVLGGAICLHVLL